MIHYSQTMRTKVLRQLFRNWGLGDSVFEDVYRDYKELCKQITIEQRYETTKRKRLERNKV